MSTFSTTRPDGPRRSDLARRRSITYWAAVALFLVGWAVVLSIAVYGSVIAAQKPHWGTFTAQYTELRSVRWNTTEVSMGTWVSDDGVTVLSPVQSPVAVDDPDFLRTGTSRLIIRSDDIGVLHWYTDIRTEDSYAETTSVFWVAAIAFVPVGVVLIIVVSGRQALPWRRIGRLRRLRALRERS